MPLARRGRASKEEKSSGRVMCCVLVYVWTLITFHKGFGTFGSCTCSLCRKVPSGVNAAEHSRTASERSQSTRCVIRSIRTQRTRHGLSLLLRSTTSPPPRQRQTSQQHVSFIGLLVRHHELEKLHADTNKNALAAVTFNHDIWEQRVWPRVRPLTSVEQEGC